MQINLQGKNLELNDAIKNYVSKRVTNLEKILSKAKEAGGEAVANFEVSKNSNHHKGGDVFTASCSIKVYGKNFYSSADKTDVYQAIDAVKENLFREISKDKTRERTLYKRGASSVKKMMKGLSKRNPLTSKY